MPVYRQPRIVLLTTGDEVVEPGIPLPEGKIYNSNMTMLSARLRELGIESFHMEAVKDDPTVMSEKLKEAAKAADMIITTGGVSVGKKDIMHESLRLMGAERIFWRVKMKPGMPTLFSAYKKTSDITATDHCASEREIPIISLSGNPFGVAVSIELLIRPALEKMMQDPSIGLKEVNGIMADNFEKGIKGRRFIRAYLENGKFHLPNGLHSNGVLSSMAGCNCLIDTKRIFAISGVKNSGKTTLICRLLEIFKDKGLKVAVLKHDGHDFVPDVPGTDTYCQLQSGAYGTAVFSAGKYMLVKQQPQISEKELAEFFPEADLILLEGFKYSTYPKIEIIRKGNSAESVCNPEKLMAIATNLDAEERDALSVLENVPFFELDNAECIAEFILSDYFR